MVLAKRPRTRHSQIEDSGHFREALVFVRSEIDPTVERWPSQREVESLDMDQLAGSTIPLGPSAVLGSS